ncbi:MAG TPA: expansin-like protein [Polyangiaceae bacterium]|nr:expansin-like protein [Polyangiaceae bacterium]
MDRLSRVSLWTLVGAALTAAGCADILGFKDFSDDADGGTSGSPVPSPEQTSGSTGGNGGTANQGGTGGSTGNGGSTGGTGSSPGGSTSGGTGGSTPSNGSSGGSSQTSSSGGGGTGGGSSSSKTTTGSSSSTGTAASSSSTLPTSSGPPPACTYASIPEPGGGTTSGSTSGSATEYYFGQCSGCFVGSTYKTACGYAGTEPTATGNFSSVDDVPNAASMSPASITYFAAIPGAASPGSDATDYAGTFNTVGACGACIELQANGKTIVATIIDECPIASNGPCAAAGHLDLSTSAFGALGYNQSGGGDPGGLSWQFVACPVSGDIQASLNSAGQVYFQNTAYPITSVSVNGQAATLTVYGYWQLPTNASGATVTLTNVEGDSVTVTLPAIATWPSSTSIGVQFQQATGCE